jgi:hypothetical protein
MTLLDRILARSMVMPTDPIIAARIERHVRRIQPDPMFRRRLRSVVVNRYVATREGLAPPVPRTGARRQMGALGRGVLYASLMTAIGTTAVAAASQETLPGDSLYGVKIQLEQLRIRIAPAGLRDDLAAIALDERLDELEQLANSGRWELVDEAASRAEAAEAQLEALIGGDPANAGASAAGLAEHLDRLEQLLTTAPASALQGLERAIEASSASAPQDGPQQGNVQEPAQPAQPAEGSHTSSGSQGSQGGGGQPEATPPPSTPVPQPSQPQPDEDGKQGGSIQGGGDAQSAKGDAQQ